MSKRPQTGTVAGSRAPSPPPEPADGFDMKAHQKRAAKAWADREFWQKLYDDAYEFAIPYRRPASRTGKGAQRVERLFDATAIKSAFRSAGQLHQDLFPPEFFKLAPGPVARAKLNDDERAQLATALEKVTNEIAGFFQGGEFDMASSETCLDLLVGTATLFPLEGDRENPVRFVCIPFDEVAIEVDGYGAVCGIFWKQRLTQRQIKSNWPEGVYPQSFINKDNTPDDEMDICQDFIRDAETKKWKFCAYLADSVVPITSAEYRTQPMAVPRYHRVPGEAYGRGPILLALPTIKTVNKAVELTLKAAAIQMLGIWGYRPGGSFNPDTVRIGPGEMWPMMSTGGVMGADVSRLDVASGRMDVAQLVTQELRLQIQSMLNDDSLPEKGATPVSATEIMARMKRISQNYLGAWGRVVQEIIPVVVRRVLEILYTKKIITTKIDIDTLLIKVEVMSPIAAAVKAAAHQRIIEFFQLCVAVKGTPEAVDLIMKVDDALRRIADDLLPASLIRTKAEQKALERQMAQAAAAIAAAQQAAAQPPRGTAAVPA
jgi:hypothetical protein